MGQLEIGPVRLRHRAELDVWILSTVREHHGHQWFVSIPVLPYIADIREPPLLFAHAFQTLEYMIANRVELL